MTNLPPVQCNGHHPFRIVEEPEFKNLVSLISHCPNYALPSRKSLSNNLLDSTYNEILAKVKVSTEAAFAVCITTDGWTSRANCSYLAITAHYIEGTELTSNVLACIEFNERHTAENIKCAIKDVTDDFGISHKISAIVTDNAANVVAAAKLTNWRWIGCFAHSLNLAVKSSLSNVSEIITKVRNVVTYFHKSLNSLKMLAEAQKQLDQPVLKLKQDVETRWNSTYEMFERINCLKHSVITTLSLTRPDLALTFDEWAIIEEILPILKPFYQMTVEISAEKMSRFQKFWFYSTS
uniref:Uncharacterized protein n=1 Tax=Musca domestica TaxID=7370 RepID=A0A1I8MV64_MUSDO